jgi:hypothetical protein
MSEHGVLLLCRAYSVLYSEIALSWKRFGVGHMYIHNFFLKMVDIMTSQNIDLPFWDALYYLIKYFIRCSIFDLPV